MKLQGKTAVVTGASRGIGLEIAKKLASEGANIVIAAKTDQPHPKLEGTIHTAAQEIENLGGKVLACKVDIRSEEEVADLMLKAVETFGGIDILVNNASAIQLTDTLHTDVKRFDLMHGVNARGTFLCSKLALPYLLKSVNPHVITLSPPLNFEAKWFRNHVAYSMAKFGMSLVTLGMSAEFEGKVAFNSLWPKTIIATAAIEFAVGNAEMMNLARKPSILADAALEIVLEDSKLFSGNYLVDEDYLKIKGVQDFTIYKVNPNTPDEKIIPDFFI
ncbi:MAG: 3-oxoacyl-[acyl-carrier-protein] reductase [Bacteroidota bacterium]|jgi:citronellol/citronellal dehydrogenase